MCECVCCHPDSLPACRQAGSESRDPEKNKRRFLDSTFGLARMTEEEQL
ncbi:MAG: hypothetical protein P9L90_01225 [Candidatus Aadella gelida]|nr:hypothetical protein [Candidatus Aadella gelida]